MLASFLDCVGEIVVTDKPELRVASLQPLLARWCSLKPRHPTMILRIRLVV
jgi:hypothetical protein